MNDQIYEKGESSGYKSQKNLSSKNREENSVEKSNTSTSIVYEEFKHEKDLKTKSKIHNSTANSEATCDNQMEIEICIDDEKSYVIEENLKATVFDKEDKWKDDDWMAKISEYENKIKNGETKSQKRKNEDILNDLPSKLKVNKYEK